MKRVWCALLFVGLCSAFTVSAGAATFTLPGKLTLYENYDGQCVPYYFRLEPMQGQIYQVSGYLQWSDGKEVFSGTAVREGKKARFAIVMPTAMDDLSPWVAEFLLDVNTREAQGVWKFTNAQGGDDQGDFFLSSGCVVPAQGTVEAPVKSSGPRHRR